MLETSDQFTTLEPKRKLGPKCIPQLIHGIVTSKTTVSYLTLLPNNSPRRLSELTRARFPLVSKVANVRFWETNYLPLPLA